MSRLATPARFTQPGGWYWQPHENRGYCRYDYFAVRAERIAAEQPRAVLVLGCAFGYLVDELVSRGVEAFGIDLSEWAIRKGKAKLPKIAERLFVGDALKRESLNPERVPLIVTEDLLPCLEDGEIAAGLPLWRSRADRVVHIVSPRLDDPERIGAPELNWKTLEEWAEIAGPDEVVLA